MNSFQKTTVIIVAAALAIGGWGPVAAQEQSDEGQQTAVQQREQAAIQQQQKTTVQQRTRIGEPIGQGGSRAAEKAHTRQLGPGDGTGNLGVPPADGTGFGSPGRLGTGSERDAAGKAAGKKGSKRAGTSPLSTSSPTLQSRARSLTGSGPGRALCDGSRRHSVMGAAGFGRPRGGHR